MALIFCSDGCQIAMEPATASWSTRPVRLSLHEMRPKLADEQHSSRLETMEGKTVAIDSSIWIYQFQATMRDKEGRGLTNAHVLGFLRRICKLLFYGMKPVFVFDGGAPALKKATLVRKQLCFP